jgi:hypothetical protein
MPDEKCVDVFALHLLKLFKYSKVLVKVFPRTLFPLASPYPVQKKL